jgi:hypothetical protein
MLALKRSLFNKDKFLNNLHGSLYKLSRIHGNPCKLFVVTKSAYRYVSMEIHINDSVPRKRDYRAVV